MNSFFPSTIKLWNNINHETKDIPIYDSFNNIIKSNYDIQNVPIHLCVGDRKSNILSTKHRNRCSELKAGLFRVNLIDSAACSCGCNIEDARHFIFICTKYQNERQSLLRFLGNFHPITLDTLLFGNDRFNSNDNITIQIALQKYIIDTKRYPLPFYPLSISSPFSLTLVLIFSSKIFVCYLCLMTILYVAFCKKRAVMILFQLTPNPISSLKK